MPQNLISIIIPTRDRAESLKRTLDAVHAAQVPDDLDAEVLVVDNGSLDRTRPVVRQAKIWGRSPRYLYEPQPGVSFARNEGMSIARGDVLLWIDDDVQPGSNWIESMCRPIVDGSADAVAGRIKLAESLERPWLKPWHRACLRVDAPNTGDFDLIGANMAFARRVLDKVPSFDRELGAGSRVGAGAEALFSRQLVQAGFRLLAADEESTVVHHCGEQRLTRTALMKDVMRQGSYHAYVDYHWKHRTVWFPSFRGGRWFMELLGLRVFQRLLGDRHSVIGRREAGSLRRWSYNRQMSIESRQPRNTIRSGWRNWSLLIPWIQSWSDAIRVRRRTSGTARWPFALIERLMMLDSVSQVNLLLMQYCRRLVDDIADERLAEQPHAGVNHPAWILGHLAWTADGALEFIGAKRLLPADWTSLFGRGSTPSAQRGLYPSKDELLRAVEQGYQQLRQEAATANPEQLARPSSSPITKEILPTAKEMVAFVLTGHAGVHLGQLTTWRRMIGLPAMF